MNPPRTAVLALIVCIAATFAGTSSARAGTYTVNGTCGLWAPYSNNGARVAVYNAGCLLVARNSFGDFSSGQGTEGGWTMSAPPGASIANFTFDGFLRGMSGWDAALYDSSGLTHAVCPGGRNCEGLQARMLDYNSGPVSVGAVTARVRCYASSCPNTAVPNSFTPERAHLTIAQTSVTVADYSAPSVAITGGSAASVGWKRGTPVLALDASDNVGIRRYEVYIDGGPVGATNRSDCSYTGQMIPCPNGAANVGVQLAGVSDGTHTLTSRAVDSAGNAASASRLILVDNIPPVAPTSAMVADGEPWRTTNDFTLQWTNPPQRFAPITGARYELCPPSADSSDSKVAAQGRKQCVRRSVAGSGLHAITRVKVPAEGVWNARRLWLVDEAGNENADTSARIEHLGFDATPPTGVAFADEDPAAPTRLRVTASDDASGIASGSIEVRRAGRQSWRQLKTRVTSDGLSARIDDERLPRGVYDLRAVATDAAGLQQGTDRRADGLPARIELPVRLRSRLTAGTRGDRRCRRVRRGDHRHLVCHRALVKAPRVRIGQSSTLRGRLTLRGKPLANRRIRISRRLVGEAEWKRLGVVHTSRTGRFRYRVSRGPARTLRFRYAGNARVRGDNAPVELRVRADSTFRSSRSLVITGEYVTFSGALRGGWLPPGGALVELQVFTRGQWRTFAQPRADRDGRWTYQYRFETIRGHATFRFRARIRRQADYPFVTGHSRTARVRVRGL